MSKKSTSKRPELTPTMQVLMQSTICLARGSGPIPRLILRELDHPAITQNIDQALDDLIALKLLKRERTSPEDVYITREGFDFREDHPGDVVVWVSMCYAVCTLVERLIQNEDAAALEEVEIHLRALTNMMIHRPGVEAMFLATLLIIHLHNTGDDHDATRYAKELEAMEKRLGKPQSAVVRLVLYPDPSTPQPVPKTEQQRDKNLKLAQKIDEWVRKLEQRGGGEEQMLEGALEYMPMFKQILDTKAPGEIDVLCQKYRGFYRFAKLLENLAGAIHDGVIVVPK